MGEKEVGMWNEEDGFYYDVLYSSEDDPVALKVRSIVGLIPLFAVETINPEVFQCLPEFASRTEELLERRSDLAKLISQWEDPGRGRQHLLALVQGPRIKSILKRMLDEEEFAASPEGRRFVTDSSDGWGQASIASGTEAEEARAAARRTTAFYTGELAEPA